MIRAFAPALMLLAAAALNAAEPAVEAQKLDNGLLVIAVHLPGSPVVHCRMACAAGHASDPEGLEGAAELLRRCSYHGTATLGTLDPEKEERTIAVIERQEEGVRRRLASVPEETLRKIKDYPTASKVLRSDVDELLRKITARDPAPMSRSDMDEISETLKTKLRLLDDLESEMERIFRDQAYGTITLVRDLEDSIRKNRESLAALRVPDPVRSEYEKCGAFSNSSATLRDLTIFSAELPSERIEVFFWLESRRFSVPFFRFFEDEKSAFAGVPASSRASTSLSDLVEEVTFQGSLLGRRVVATPAESIDVSALNSFREKTWKPSSTVVVVAGGVEPARVFALAARYFGSIPGGQPEPRPGAQPEAAPVIWNVFAGYRSATLRFALPPSSSPDTPALEVLAALLSSPSSKLFQGTVGAGLAANLDVRVLESSLSGVFEIRAAAASGAWPLTLSSALLAGLALSLEDMPSADDVSAAVAASPAELEVLATEPSALADRVALFAARRGAPPSPSRFEGLTPEKVRDAGRKYIAGRKVTVVITEED